MAESSSSDVSDRQQRRSSTGSSSTSQSSTGRKSSYSRGGTSSSPSSTAGMNPASNPRTQSTGAGGRPISRDGLRSAESGAGTYRPQGDAAGRPSATPRGSTTSAGDHSGTSGAVSSTKGPNSKNKDDDFKFNPNDKSHRGSARHVLRAASRRRNIALFAGLTTGITGLIVTVFFVLIPLKIEHILTNLEERYLATSENAVDKESENMLSDYIKRSVLPALTKCSGSTIDKNCNPAFGNSNNPVDALYKGWSQARLENKLAEDHGIKFSYNRYTGKYYMTVPGITNPNGDDITGFTHDDKDIFLQVSRGQVRQNVRVALKDESKLTYVMRRYQIGGLLDQKYAVKRCLIFCGVRDALADRKADQKNAAQLYLAERILVPRTQMMGIVIQCALDTNCEPNKSQPTTAQDGTNSTQNGAPESQVDTELQTTLQQLAEKTGSRATAEQLDEAYKNLSDNGLQKIVLQEILAKINLGDLADPLVENASIIQWANTASKYIVILKSAGPKLKSLTYKVNSTTAVKFFSTFRTEADEIHTGHQTATEVGSWAKAFDSNTTTEGVVGGTASAEQTPLWGNLINKSSSSTGSKNYTCADNKPVGKELICPEEKLGGGNAAANAITSTLSTPPLSYITDVAGAWQGVAGGISNFVGNIFGTIISNIPGVNGVISDATSFVTKAAQPFFKFLTDKAIRNPVGLVNGGDRAFDEVAIGSDVAGNAYSQTGLGGGLVSATKAATIAAAQDTTNRQDFSRESFFARMFSTDSQYSLVSSLAMATPINIQASAQTSFASFIGNPFGILSSSFASIFSAKARADSSTLSGIVDGQDFADVNQYAPEVVDHPRDYWDQHCSDNASYAYMQDNSWNEAAANYNTNSDDDPSGQPVNTTPNPCLTIKSSVGAVGGIFDTSLLTKDEVSHVSTAPTSASTNPVSGNAQQLAQQILSNSNIDLTCLSSSVKQDVQDAAAGKSGTAGAPVSAAILKLIVTIGQGNHVCITAIESNGQGHTSGSYHYSGDAVDFGSLNGTAITGRNAPAIAIINQAVSILPNNSALGQLTCAGTTPFIPPSWTTFIDTCNHLHVQVPKGTP